MTLRRTFLAAAVAAPAFFQRPLSAARGYSWQEIERMIARGDVKGKLTRDDLPTPALLLDLDKFEANVKKMADHAKASGRALRPHAKTHKSADIARYLMKNGAVGACCAKISEAEALAVAGITGLHLTSSMVGRGRIERAVRLTAKHPDTIVSTDSAQNIEDLNAAAGAAKVKLNVAIDLLIGNRTGITPGEPAAALAELIARQPNLKFQGIQAYAGHSSHVKGFEARQKHSQGTMGLAVDTRRLIEKKGIACAWLSGGSTGTYNIDSEIDGVTELQPGSYVFMDVGYNGIGGSNGDARYTDFGNSLTVLSTVYSKPSDDVAIVDAGLKAFATDSPAVPDPLTVKGITYQWAGDEHGRILLKNAERPVNLGDRIEFINTHCDPTVNLYDRMFCLRGDNVEAVWRVTARGMSQ